MTRFARLAALAALMGSLAGCRGFEITHRNVFSDADGNCVTIDYGRSESDHRSTFVSPVTGKELEFKSRLAVEVELPDGDSFVGWQCMNFTKGTMYQSNDEEWKVLVAGFSCIIYRRTDEEPPRYREVYSGVVCDTPEIEVEKNDKWKDVMWHGREYRRGETIKYVK